MNTYLYKEQWINEDCQEEIQRALDLDKRLRLEQKQACKDLENAEEEVAVVVEGSKKEKGWRATPPITK